MIQEITTVGTPALIGILLGYFIKEKFGGKRSDIGVHRSDGRLMQFQEAVVKFSAIALITSIATTLLTSFLFENFSKSTGFAIAFGGVVILLSDSYSR